MLRSIGFVVALLLCMSVVAVAGSGIVLYPVGQLSGANSELFTNNTAGQWKFSCTGGTNNEDVSLDCETSANTITWSSGSSANLFKLSSIGLDVTGQMITEGDGTYSWGHSPSGIATEGSVEIDGMCYADAGITTPSIAFTIPATLTVAANAVALNWANGDSQVVDLEGATGLVTITMTNPSTTVMTLKIIQGTNLGTVVFSPVIHTAGGAALTAITGTNDAVDRVVFNWTGSAYELLSHTQDIKAIP